MTVFFDLHDFVTGRPIVSLPVMEGASWSAQLNRPDSVVCSIDLNDEDARALDLRSASEPNKTILLARTESDQVLAWGLIPDDGREWDEDTRKLTLTAVGIGSSWLGQCIVAPVAARTAELTTLDAEGFPVVNPALDTVVSGVSHGTIMKRLVQQLLSWPGAPTVFDLPADEVGTRTQTYTFASLKSVGSAIDDLSRQEDGPDYAFDAYRGEDGLTLRYLMRVGTEAKPRLGGAAGSWSLGGNSPLVGLKITDTFAAGASAGWMTAGRQSGVALITRVLNDRPTSVYGYPPLHLVDTSHTDVSEINTLNAYNRENMRDAETATRDLTFSVRGDATPGIGDYRPGDVLAIDVPDGHPWHAEQSIPIRVTSVSGDETGDLIKIGCMILDGTQ